MKEAQAAFERAQRHLKRASENSDDPDEVFIWGFYALENAVVAAAIQAGAPFAKNHRSKATAARGVANKCNLPDVSNLLGDLNEARKGSAYGDVDAPEIDPKEVLAQVGRYVKEVEELLQKNEE